MTRINANLDPKVLLDQHLMAEYRETPMVHAALRRSLRTKSKESVLKSIPDQFRLNSGHVTFFYDKLRFLELRYDRLIEELKFRGFNLDENRKLDATGIPFDFYYDWSMGRRDAQIIIERILTRFYQKPEWYRYLGAPINQRVYEKILINSIPH